MELTSVFAIASFCILVLGATMALWMVFFPHGFATARTRYCLALLSVGIIILGWFCLSNAEYLASSL